MNERVTPADVARMIEGEISDPVEERRVMDAIVDDPELGEIWELLSDPDVDQIAEDPLDGAEVDEMRTRLTKLGRATLWPVLGNPFRKLAKPGSDESGVQTVVFSPGGTIKCSFSRNEANGACQLNIDTPPGFELLNVIVAKLALGDCGDLTRRVVRNVDAWNGLLKDEETYSLAAKSLDGKRSDSGSEVAGESLDVSILPDRRSIFVSAKEMPESGCLPLRLTGHRADGNKAKETRLLRDATEDLCDLFATAAEPIVSIDVSPLPADRLHELTPADATELLSHHDFDVATVEAGEESSAKMFRFTSPPDWLDDPNVVVSLQVAPIDHGDRLLDRVWANANVIPALNRAAKAG